MGLTDKVEAAVNPERGWTAGKRAGTAPAFK
jgi:hypothetical protein